MAFIISDLILDSRDYCYKNRNRRGATDYQGYVTNDLVYANNYEYSHIRSWLNTIFYFTVFDTFEKQIINTTMVYNLDYFASGLENKYSCGIIVDKMFLLSNEEVKTYYLSNELRTAKSSDYAKSQALHVYAGERNSFYKLRTPDCSECYCSCNVGFDGRLYYNKVNLIGGVRLACWINL